MIYLIVFSATCRNPPVGIPSRQNIVDILLIVMVHDKGNAFSVSHEYSILYSWKYLRSLNLPEMVITIHV